MARCFSRMQERHGLRSRAAGRLLLVRRDSLMSVGQDARSCGIAVVSWRQARLARAPPRRPGLARYLKEPAIRRALESTGEPCCSFGAITAFAASAVLLGLPHAEASVLTAQLIREDVELLKPGWAQ